MITTVSTTTVTTVTAIAAMGLTATLGVAAAILLIFFLSTREISSTTGRQASLRLARFVSIGIVPLLLAFAVSDSSTCRLSGLALIRSLVPSPHAQGYLIFSCHLLC